jgi:ketosteroid isomerase-like protein
VGENTPGFGAALRVGDVGTATALLSATPARHARLDRDQGRRQIGVFLRQFCDMSGELIFEQRSMVTAGDIAIGSENWTVQFAGNGGSVRRTSRSTIVLNRIEGFWRIAVVDPWRSC